MKNFREIEGVFYDDPNISKTDKKHIRVLEEESCVSLWKSLVSNESRHFMLLNDTEWPSLIVNKNDVFYHWLDDWNINKSENFKQELLKLPISKNEIIYYFWMQEIGIKTTWSVFCDNWINFLYEDEGCVLVCLENKTSLIFSNGRSWYGTKS